MAETEKLSDKTLVTTLDSSARIPLFDENGAITGITSTNFKSEMFNGDAVSDVDYIIGKTSDGKQVKISKADLASVVGGLLDSGQTYDIRCEYNVETTLTLPSMSVFGYYYVAGETNYKQYFIVDDNSGYKTILNTAWFDGRLTISSYRTTLTILNTKWTNGIDVSFHFIA